MRKWCMVLLLCLTLFPCRIARAECFCMCDAAAAQWAAAFAQFRLGFQPFIDLGVPLGEPGTITYHAWLVMNGFYGIQEAAKTKSIGKSYAGIVTEKSDSTVKAQNAYDRDHIDRMARFQMEATRRNVREETLLQQQDVGIEVKGEDCPPDLQHSHAAIVNAAQSNLLKQKQLGREAMRHNPGQATDVVKKRKEAAAQYETAFDRAYGKGAAEASYKSKEKGDTKERVHPAALPQNGDLVFRTNDLYTETRNMIRKLVELDRPFEDVSKLRMNDDHKNEYVTLRDARKMISNLRAEGLETTIDWYAPIMPKSVIDILTYKGGVTDAKKYYTSEKNAMTSLAAEHTAFAELQLGAAMAEHINSDNAATETALLLTHIFALEQRRTQMLQLFAAMLASEEVMPKLDQYIDNLRRNSGEEK